MAQDEDTEVTDDTDTPCTPPNTSDVLSNLPQSTCRESSRIRTPITCPGFIPTQTQSHQAAASKCYASTSAKGNQQKTTSINSSNGSSSSNNEVTKETASAQVKQVRRRTGNVIDIDKTQDSDEENCQAPAGKRKDLEKDKDRFDHSQLYFYPPGLGPNQVPFSYFCFSPKNTILTMKNRRIPCLLRGPANGAKRSMLLWVAHITI
jgi:hypothetical protein